MPTILAGDMSYAAGFRAHTNSAGTVVRGHGLAGTAPTAPSEQTHVSDRLPLLPAGVEFPPCTGGGYPGVHGLGPLPRICGC